MALALRAVCQLVDFVDFKGFYLCVILVLEGLGLGWSLPILKREKFEDLEGFP